ncbi:MULTISPECIES: amino acid ABC transporter permease [Rossellomorea]|uniref:amino acid ABC transporter permease n=1 Tax=Rossellomorea TaxID=2837508 RepID=UPI00064ECBF7|nr:amino acid ABC transporter permease [Rossellomorea marisflavi]KML32208.1 glutamine ABC transporter permease [Rossellomorea marisflavi]MBV6684707.1 amino acid ABC transporter permease [Bacillus sp. JRC01]TYO74025.1 amino acid ABC transporter permease [Rossellomorea marisflavi]
MDFIGAYSADNVSFLLSGFLMTLRVAAIAIVLSFTLGTLIAIIRYAKVPVLSQILAFVVNIIRNLPLLLIIFFMKFALPEVGIDLDTITAAIAGLTIFEAALISELVRSGLNSIDKGQIEAARSSGLNYVQTLRLIVLPQALQRMVPPTVSQFIALLKDTSLAVVISLPELMHHARIINGGNQDYVIPIFILVALMYFTVNYLLSLSAKRFEAKHT